MGRPNVAARLAGLRPCGCTGTRLCPEHWRALTAEQRREWAPYASAPGGPIGRCPVTLLQPDGSVVIPPSLAAEVLRRLIRDMNREARENGVAATTAALALAEALDRATRVLVPLNGSDAVDESIVDWVTVARAAEAMGCTTRWVRELVRSGQLPAHRHEGTRAWRIFAADLDRYRHERRPA